MYSLLDNKPFYFALNDSMCRRIKYQCTRDISARVFIILIHDVVLVQMQAKIARWKRLGALCAVWLCTPNAQAHCVRESKQRCQISTVYFHDNVAEEMKWLHSENDSSFSERTSDWITVSPAEWPIIRAFSDYRYKEMANSFETSSRQRLSCPRYKFEPMERWSWVILAW